MNYPGLKGRGIPFEVSSFGGFHPRLKDDGVPPAKIKNYGILSGHRTGNPYGVKHEIKNVLFVFE